MLEAGVKPEIIEVCADVKEAFDRAKQTASIIDKIIIFGSFITVTAALPLV